MTRSHTRLALVAAASLLPALALPPEARAVLHYYSTPLPADQISHNTTAPSDPALLDSGWQFQGTWSNFLGTPIAPEYFITAAHVAGGVGGGFTLNGVTRTVIRFADGTDFKTVPGTDLRIWRVGTPFSSYAPLYNAATDGAETGKSFVVFGRGTQRGISVNNPTLKGWQWGADDHVQRWGQNKVSAISDYSTAGDQGLLKFTFDAPGNGGYSGVNEAALSRGDSGGALFIQVGATWKLAGINLGVSPSSFAYSSLGPSFNGSLFDIGGMYYQNSGNTLVFQPESPTDIPTENYVSRISPNLTAIRHFTNAWGVDGNGMFTTAGNWANSLVPTSNYPAFFGSAITAPRTVTLNNSRTIGSLGFDNANRYTLSGTGTLNLNNTVDASPARIGVHSGSHTVSVNVLLNVNTTVNVNQAGSTLTFTKPLDNNGDVIVTKTGLGTMEVPTFRDMDLTVSAGTVRIAPDGTDAGASSIGSLLISSGGRLDLTNNDLVLPYSVTSPLGSVRTWLLAAHNGGAWNGATGITSSTAATDPNLATAFAYAEAFDVLGLTGNATATWSGQTVDATTVLLKYTYYGDANFDGRITAEDYALLDRGRARGLSGWINGDFNYDNLINNADQLLIDRGYIFQSGALSPEFLAMRESQYGADYVTALISAVPEPSITASLLATLLLRRRPRRA